MLTSHAGLSVKSERRLDDGVDDRCRALEEPRSRLVLRLVLEGFISAFHWATR
mgnify:CR=1 FL=1